MNNQESLNKLIPLEQMFNKGENFQQILDRLGMFTEKEINSDIALRLRFFKLKANTLFKLGNYVHCIEFAHSVIKESQSISTYWTYTIDCILILADALRQLDRLEDSLIQLEGGEKLIIQMKELLSPIPDLNPPEIMHQQARLQLIRGIVYWRKGNFEKALACYDECLQLWTGLDNKYYIGVVNNNFALIYTDSGQLDKAFPCLEQSITIWKLLGNKQNLAYALNNLGNLFQQKGELLDALLYISESLEVRKQLGNKNDIGICYANIGFIKRLQGELEEAIANFREAIELFKEVEGGGVRIYLLLASIGLGVAYYSKGDMSSAYEIVKSAFDINQEIGNNIHGSDALYNLIKICIELKKVPEATRHLEHLRQMTDKEKNRVIEQRYLLGQVILAKIGTGITNTTEIGFESVYALFGKYVNSLMILHQIIADKNIADYELTIDAIFNLCEILFLEMRMFGKASSANEINGLVEKLLEIAQNQHSYDLFIKTYMLKAKMSLLKLQVEEAHVSLDKAEEIARTKGFERLENIILIEQKKLILDNNSWLLDEKVPLIERMNRLHLDAFIQSLMQNRLENWGEREKPLSPTYEDLQVFTNELEKRKLQNLREW